LKKDINQKYKLLKVSTRLAGTSCLSRNLDVNLPLLSILDFSEKDIDSILNFPKGLIKYMTEHNNEKRNYNLKETTQTYVQYYNKRY